MVYVLIFFWSLISLKINMTGRICIHEETESVLFTVTIKMQGEKKQHCYYFFFYLKW